MSIFNSFLFNALTFNGVLTGSAISSDDIAYGALGLQNTNIITRNVADETSMPRRKLTIVDNPSGDGSLIRNDIMPKKQITVTGSISADTTAELDTLIDDFKKKLAIPSQQLKIGLLGGGSRFYTANLINGNRIIQRQHHHISFVEFTLAFECYEPFAKDQTQQIITASGQTADHDFSIINSGTAESKPIFIITLNSATTVTTINIKNTTTDEEIEVSPVGGFSTSDILEVNAEDKIVKLNGTEVDFDGFFWNLLAGENTITIDLDGTFDFDLTVKYFLNYL